MFLSAMKMQGFFGSLYLLLLRSISSVSVDLYIIQCHREMGDNEDPKPGPSKPREDAESMTLAEYLALPENQGANLVMPIPWCPHLEQLGKFDEFEAMSTASSSSLIEAKCRQCDNVGENWVCLSCFSVQCSRYVNEHMLIHGLETDHRYTTAYPSILNY